MPRPGRNQPCPCGSGRKVKRCCQEQRGPATDQLERAFIAGHAHQAATEIADLPNTTLRELWESLIDLPDLDLSLVLTMPTLIGPELEELLQAAIDDDLDPSRSFAAGA